VKPHSSSEYLSLQVSSPRDHVFDRVTVANATDVLIDDGTLAQLLGNVMTGRSNQLHAALVGLVVWLLADEGG
jgi:hypothetical protein